MGDSRALIKGGPSTIVNQGHHTCNYGNSSITTLRQLDWKQLYPCRIWSHRWNGCPDQEQYGKPNYFHDPHLHGRHHDQRRQSGCQCGRCARSWFGHKQRRPRSLHLPNNEWHLDLFRTSSSMSGGGNVNLTLPSTAGAATSTIALNGDYSGFARFAEAILEKSRLDASGIHSELPHFTYRSLAGHTLDITFRPHQTGYTNQHKIHGKPVQYASYPHFGNPWVRQPFRGRSTPHPPRRQILILRFCEVDPDGKEMIDFRFRAACNLAMKTALKK